MEESAEKEKEKRKKATTSTTNGRRPSSSPPDLSSSSIEDWSFLGEGGANVVFSYEGPDPELAGLVLRLRKKKIKHPSALEEAVEASVWAPLFADDERSAASSAADRDAAFALRVVAPLVGRQYLLVSSSSSGSVVSVPRALHASFERRLAAQGASRRRNGEGRQELVAEVEERGALLRNAARWDSKKTDLNDDEAPSLCVELKPKCGLPHGEGRRSKVRLKQQLRQRKKSTSSSSYCPFDFFSGEGPRRKKALGALLSDALSRDFSHSAPRSAHFRLFGADGKPLEGIDDVREAVSSLFSSARGDDGNNSSRSSLFKLLVASLESIFSSEPLLENLLESQRCPECPTAEKAAERLAVLKAELLPSASTTEGAREAPLPLSPAAEEAASALRSYLATVTTRDLSIMVLMRRGGGEEGSRKPLPRLQRDAAVGGAVDVALPSSPAPRRLLLRYRIALADLDAKPVSKAESHAAADAALPRSGKRRGVEKS